MYYFNAYGYAHSQRMWTFTRQNEFCWTRQFNEENFPLKRCKSEKNPFVHELYLFVL